MKQTAVEWLEKELKGVYESDYFNRLLDQAKEMEKEQIMDAWNDGNNRFSGIGDAETFYETFKSE